MIKRRTVLCSVLPSIVVGLFLLAPVTFAESDIPSGAFVVRPAKVELELAPGESKVVDVVLENGTPSPLSISVSNEDISSKAQTNAADDPMTLSGNGDATHTLKDMVSVLKSKFDILSYKSIHVPVMVTIPKTALPGGRYGSVVFEFSPAITDKDQQVQNIAVKSRVATLFFVRIKGQVHEEGALVSFGLFNNAHTTLAPTALLPLRFTVSFENKGDIQLNPHGAITISGTWGGSKVAVIDPWVVLPGATRMREIDIIDSLSPGYYKAKLELARGYADTIDNSEVGFWVLPSPVQTAFGLIIFSILILLLRRSLAISRNSVS